MPDEGQRELRRLGDAIRQQRKQLPGKVSQEDFAEMCGVHRTYIGHVERGEKNISLVNLLRIAKAFRQRPSVLLDHAGL